MSAAFERFTVSVPASSANLGPGFDAVAIALSLRMRARVEPATRFDLSFSGGAIRSSGGIKSLMIRAMREVNPVLPAARVRIHNDIPLGKGLGSSAAAIVLALAIAGRAYGQPAIDSRIAQIACRLEGHPDNVLAARFGGVIVAGSADPSHYLRLTPMSVLRPVLIVPDLDLETTQARALLPASYQQSDMIFTAQRAALLGATLASGTWETLREAMQDRMHQPFRATKIPGLNEALAIRDDNLAGIALSGAGPSMIALVKSACDWKPIAERIAACFIRAGVQTNILPLTFSERGMSIRTLRRGIRTCVFLSPSA